jgi:hypothetical protein
MQPIGLMSGRSRNTPSLPVKSVPSSDPRELSWMHASNPSDVVLQDQTDIRLVQVPVRCGGPEPAMAPSFHATWRRPG